MIFGGEVIHGSLYLTEFIGSRTHGLPGLDLPSGWGLGGQVVEQSRPMGVSDYVHETAISHEYDDLILGEGLREMLAVPYQVGGNVRGVFYTAMRRDLPLGDRIADLMREAADRLSTEVALRDEVDRRVALLTSLTPGSGTGDPTDHSERSLALNPAQLELMRDVQADLLAIAGQITDRDLSARLHASFRRLSALSAGRPEDHREPSPLSPREVDVLAQAALGCRNAEIAERLSIGVESVNGYLRSAAAKLGTHSRLQSVAEARRRGWLV